MRPIPLAILALPLAVAACVSTTTAPAPPPQIVVAQPRPTLAVAAPVIPPPPQAELVPPPPASTVPMTWQPGHWTYTGITGSPWSWQNGQYVAVPPGYHTWVQGQWTPQGGGFVWQDGHWA